MKPDLYYFRVLGIIPCFLCSELIFRDSCELQYFCKPELNSQDKSGFWVWGASRLSLSTKCWFSKVVFCHLGTVEGGTGTDSTSQRAVPFCLNHGTFFTVLTVPCLAILLFQLPQHMKQASLIEWLPLTYTPDSEAEQAFPTALSHKSDISFLCV